MAQKGKILVVDDDRLVLATLTHGLAAAGYDIIDADNGDDAMLLARAHRPDLALLDIRMEGKSGFDVAEFLRDYMISKGIPRSHVKLQRLSTAKATAARRAEALETRSAR